MLESYFALGGMDVDVNLLSGQGQVKHGHRMTSDHQSGAVASPEGLLEGA